MKIIAMNTNPSHHELPSADVLEIAQRTPWPRHLEELSCLFFEATSDAVVIVNDDGRVVHLNSQAEKLFGYRRDELLDQTLEMLLPERWRAQHVEHLRAYFRNPQPRAMGTSFAAVGLRKDGTEIPIDIALSPLPTKRGLFVAGAVRDMTPQRLLEDELRQRMRDLEDADLHKDQFLTTLAHELSSPLAAVAYCLELLRRPETATDVRVEATGIALEQVIFVRRLSKDLGEIPLIRRGDIPVRKAAIDLVDIARRAVDIVRPLIEQNGLALETVMPPSPVGVLGDDARLVQIATNLLTNAARYTPEGGSIRLTVEQENGMAVLIVKDNGIGIPKEMLERVFVLFARLEGAKQRYASGMGIGLALVRHLVEIQGGSVEALSDGENGGSEFVVRLPLAGMKAEV